MGSVCCRKMHVLKFAGGMWHDNVMFSSNNITRSNSNITITTDASMLGWGAVCDNVSTGGLFNHEEANCHINVLELKAVLFGLKALCRNLYDRHIKILADNTTPVHAINNMGSCRSQLCDFVVKEIWDLAIHHQCLVVCFTHPWHSKYRS